MPPRSNNDLRGYLGPDLGNALYDPRYQVLPPVCGRPAINWTPGLGIPAQIIGGDVLPNVAIDVQTQSTPEQIAVFQQVRDQLLRPLGDATGPGIGPVTNIPSGIDGGFGPMLGDNATVCLETARCPNPERVWAPALLDVRVAGATDALKHWADLDVAAAWFNYANALAADPAWEATLNAPPIDGAGWTDAQLRQAWEAQQSYVRSILQCIANGYNALNIPWYVDPVARHLWRVYLAGDVPNQEFLPYNDYNAGNWYAKVEQEKDWTRLAPVMAPGQNAAAGIIPKRARAMFNAMSLDDAPLWRLYFRISAGLRLVPLAGEFGADGAVVDPYLAAETVNDAFATPQSFGEVRADAFGKTVNLRRVVRDPAIATAGRIWPNSELLHDWRAMSYAWGVFSRLEGHPVTVSAPLISYLPWLRDWAASLAVRPVQQILRDSRQNVIEVNARWIQALGGVAAFLRKVAGRDATIAGEETANANMPLTVVSLVAAGAGAALAAPTAGISLVVGGAISAVTGVLAHVFTSGDVNSSSKDDLGRWKPNFERAFLSGDITLSDGTPRQTVPAPPGFCRVIAHTSVAAGPALNPPAPPPPGGGTGIQPVVQEEKTDRTPWIVGGVAAAVLVTALTGALVMRARRNSARGPRAAHPGERT